MKWFNHIPSDNNKALYQMAFNQKLSCSYIFIIALFTNLLFIFSPQSNFAQEKKSINDIRADIQNLHKEWHLIGSAIAVIKDGEIIIKETNGTKILEGTQRVDSKTLFPIASLSKAITATALGLLVDEGKISWNSKVKDFIPEFQLYNDYLTEEVTIRDLIIHNIGLSQDYIYTGAPSDYEETLLEGLKQISPEHSFRSRFKYQTTSYALAGKVIENVTNDLFENFVRKKIFIPIGMKNTFVNYNQSKYYENRAEPHVVVNNKLGVLENQNYDNLGPGAGMLSNLDDMIKWTQFLLDSGRNDSGKEIIASDTYKELFSPQIIVPEDEFYLTSKIFKPLWITYSMGWFQHDYFGKKVAFHTGNLSGYMSILGLMHEEKIGVIVLANNYSIVRQIIMYSVFDSLTGNDQIEDWSQALREARRANR